MILFLDDDEGELTPYLEAMQEAGLDAGLMTSVDGFVAELGSIAQALELVVLDMAMPTGRTFADEKTNGGLRTGEFLYMLIRERLPHVPIVVFTNRSLHRLPRQLTEDDNCWCHGKNDLLPTEFVEMIRSTLQKLSET